MVKRLLALTLTTPFLYIYEFTFEPFRQTLHKANQKPPYLNWGEAEKVIILASIPFKIQIFMYESNTTDLNRTIHVYNFMHTFNLWRNRP